MMSYPQFAPTGARFSAAIPQRGEPADRLRGAHRVLPRGDVLGILLFGLAPRAALLHVSAALLVAAGTSLSAFWILAANSWMHTPAGHVVRDGIAYPVDWIAIIFNPSFPYRFLHMLTACYLTTSLVVLAVRARYLLAGRFVEEARTMVRMALGMVVLLAPLQLVIRRLPRPQHREHQPAKVAAMEGHWDGTKPAPLLLFAWPDEANETQRRRDRHPQPREPHHHPPDRRPVPQPQGLSADERPPVAPVFSRSA